MVVAARLRRHSRYRSLRAHDARRDQLDRPHARIGDGQMVRDALRRRSAEPDGTERVQVAHDGDQRAPGQRHAVPVEDELGPLGRRRDAAHLVERAALERVHHPQRLEFGPRGQRAEVPEGVEQRGAISGGLGGLPSLGQVGDIEDGLHMPRTFS